MPAVCLNLRYFDRLAHALLRLTFHDSNDDDPVSGEIEGRRAREAAWLMQAGVYNRRKVICQLTHSTPSIMSMHDAGYPPKVQQPVNKMLM
ncbi:TPA: hypothetical protein ACH3X3_003838 [Trebouxia sp. C0006]